MHLIGLIQVDTAAMRTSPREAGSCFGSGTSCGEGASLNTEQRPQVAQSIRKYQVSRLTIINPPVLAETIALPSALPVTYGG